MKAALYARVSTAGHGQSVDLQLEELRSVAQQRSWTTNDYSDSGISGATPFSNVAKAGSAWPGAANSDHRATMSSRVVVSSSAMPR